MLHTGIIPVEGEIEIGNKLEIVERLAVADGDNELGRRQTIEYVLRPRDEPICFADEGLTQGYLVFGRPGQGKTYFIRKILAQLLAHRDEDRALRYGGLIIDPKADYPEFVAGIVKKLNRKELVTVFIGPGAKPINILHCGLSPENLARIISATCSALAKGADEYFHNNLTVVLSGILVSKNILARHDGRGDAPTLSMLLDTLCGSSTIDGQRKRNLELHIEVIDRLLRVTAPAAPERRRPGPFAPKGLPRPPGQVPAFSTEERAELSRCADDLRAFLKEEKSYVVVQLFKQAFEAIQRLDFLSGKSRINDVNLYDDIINNGRVVLVSIPPSETYASAVFTLMKNIFQKVVLDRFARFDRTPGATRAITSDKRPVFLICDEYHLSASDSPKVGVGDSTFLSLARTFGCFTLLATQGLEQLKTSALAERWEAVLGLLAAKIFFPLGDNSTAELASDLGGEQDSLFRGESLNEARDGRSWGSSDQLTQRRDLPKYVVLRSIKRGEAAIVGTLDGLSKSSVHVVSIGEHPPWMRI